MFGPRNPESRKHANGRAPVGITRLSRPATRPDRDCYSTPGAWILAGGGPAGKCYPRVTWEHAPAPENHPPAVPFRPARARLRVGVLVAATSGPAHGHRHRHAREQRHVPLPYGPRPVRP